MKTILSYLGFNQVTSTRLSRLDSLSIVSRQSVLAMVVVCLTMISGNAWGTSTNTSVTISTYASAHSWANNTRYTSVTIDSHISASATYTSGSNVGKYYSTDNTWRFYQSEGGKLVLSAGSGYKITSFTITFTTSDKGALKYYGNSLTSGTAVSNLYAGTVELVAGSSSGSKGKVLVSQIAVTYVDGSTEATYNLVTDASTLTAGDVLVFGYSTDKVAGFFYNGFMTVSSASISAGVLTSDEALEFTLGGSSGAWTFGSSSNTLRATGSSTLTLATSGGTNTWTIVIGGSSPYNATIKNTSFSTSGIYYNTSDPRFKNYTSASGYVQIYKKASSKTCDLYDCDGLMTDDHTGALPNSVTHTNSGWTFAGIWSKRQYHMQNSSYAYASGYYYSYGATNWTNGESLYAVYYCTSGVTTYYSTYGDGNALNVDPASGSFYITSSTAPNYLKVLDGTTVTLTATGFTPHTWTIKEHDSGDAVSYTTPSSTTAQFTMPDVEVDVIACADLSGETPEFETDNLAATSTDMLWSCDYATYYLLQVKNPSSEVVYNQTSSSTWAREYYTLTGLTPKTTYTVRVYGVNACGETSTYISNALNTSFTTKGWTVTYNTNGGGGTTPTDATEYANSASVTLLNKNNNTSVTDKYFAGWTDNSSGTGTIYKPGDTYTITSDVTFYAKWISCSSSNTPQNVTITNDNTTAVTISWDAVTDATKYVIDIVGDENSEEHTIEVTAPATSKIITASDASPDYYVGTITPYKGTIAMCPADIEDGFTLSAGCPNYSFHFGTDKGSDWNDPADYCFVKSTSDGNGGYFYLLEDFTMPAKPDFYLGWQGEFSEANAKSKTLGFGTIPFDLQRTKTIGTYDGGNTQGAIGILRIRSSYGDDNRYIGFIPGGYVLRLGTDGTGWTSYAFTAASANYYETVWTTDIMTLTAGILGGNAYVGLKTSDSFVWNSTYSQSNAINGNMGQKSGTSTWGSNLSSSNDVGKRGKFRIWADNTAKNWNLHFVPYHRIIFHANYPVGVSPADTYSVDVSVEETNSSISLNSAPSAPTGYTFDGWYDAATGGTKKTGSQTISAGASEDPEYYAHWTINTHSVNYSAPSNGDYTISVAGGAATSATKDADYGQTITLAATPNTGYEFTSWTVTGETSGDEITVSNNQFTMPDEDVTVEATFTAIDYNVTYSAPSNGNYTIKVASGTASSATKTANYGQTITLAATPSGGYDFSSWTITNTSTSADVTSSVSLSSSSTSPATFTMPAYGVTVTAAFGVQTYSITYKDQGGGAFSGTQTDPPTTHTYGTATTLKIPTKTGYTFGGWFTTSGCTAGSEVGNTTSASLGATAFTANITLYAKWSVNSYNVAVANTDHVTITATPASELAIGEGSNRDVNYGKSVTLAYSGLESKNYWGGWVVTNARGDDVTASVVVGNTLTVPAYAVTVSAMTYGELVAWCDPQIEVSDGFCLTSYYIDAAASTTNTVYTTSAAGNLLTINSTDLGGVDRVEFIYLDGSDNPVALTSSPFRMCNDGSENYNIADPKTTATSWTKSGLSNTCALSYSLSYKPTNYNLMDNYKLKMVFKKGASDVRKTIIREMNGRSLPEEFVIAVKGGDQWYALPNTLKGTQGDQGSIVPVKITVDNPSGTPTQATYAPDIAIYKGRAKYATANPSSMALTSNGSNYLQTSSVSDVYKMWLSSSGDADDVDWYFKSSDRSVYELTMDPVNNPSKKMAFYDATYMGYYGGGAGTASYDIYLLPVETKYTDIPATASEWGQYSVVLAANPGATANKAQARIEAGSPTSDQTITAINAAMGTAKRVKVPVGSINLADLTNNEGKLLYIDWYEESTLLGTSCVTIPRIIAEDRTANKTNDTDKKVWNTEVHVLPGATLTIDGNTFVTGVINSTVSVKELHVYPGATINVSTGKLSASTLRLRNGWTRAGTKKYDVARVYINASNDAALEKTTASMDYDIYELTDGRHYYPLAVPFETAVNTIDYADTYLAGFSNYGTTGQYVIKEYDGARRAESGPDQANNWTAVSSSANLTPGKGYIMTAVAVKGEAIIRVPLTFDNGWTADGEKASYGGSTKNVVAVSAYDGTAASAHDRHKGWNMLGVPFMSCYGAGTDMYSGGDASLINGELVVNTDADQNMEYQSTTIPYVSVPSHDFAEYVQTDITETKLLPGWSFFVQVDEDGDLTFAVSNQRPNNDNPIYAPKRSAVDEVLRTGIILSDGEASDKTTILISDQYSGSEYEIGADLEKMFGNGYTLATYSLSGSTRLAYNAMSKSDATAVIPIGYRAPAEGEYTYSLNPRYAEANFERVDLIDYQTGSLTNLMTSSYTFTTGRTQDDSRFALNVVMKPTITTDVEAVSGERLEVSGVQKVIINDHMYIIRSGKMYDATGKCVKGGQK